MSEQQLSIPEVVKGIYDWIKPHCDENGIELKVARDPWQALYLLGACTGGYLCVLHWGGDSEFAGNINCPLARHRIELTLLGHTGPDPEPGKSAFDDALGAESLLSRLDRLRERTLSYIPSTSRALARVRYKSAEPVTTPEGFPFAAYRLSLELDAGMRAFNVTFHNQ